MYSFFKTQILQILPVLSVVLYLVIFLSFLFVKKIFSTIASRGFFLYLSKTNFLALTNMYIPFSRLRSSRFFQSYQWFCNLLSSFRFYLLKKIFSTIVSRDFCLYSSKTNSLAFTNVFLFQNSDPSDSSSPISGFISCYLPFVSI
jgi:hypothetical protein